MDLTARERELLIRGLYEIPTRTVPLAELTRLIMKIQGDDDLGRALSIANATTERLAEQKLRSLSDTLRHVNDFNEGLQAALGRVVALIDRLHGDNEQYDPVIREGRELLLRMAELSPHVHALLAAASVE